MSDEEETINRGLILLTERNPYERPFTELIDYAKDQGFSVVRLDKLSEDEEEIQPDEYHHLIDRALEALEEGGVNYIGAIGESKGTDLLTQYPGLDKFEFLILWSPTQIEKTIEFDGPHKILYGSDDKLAKDLNLREAFPNAKIIEIEGKGDELGQKAVSKSESIFLSSRM